MSRFDCVNVCQKVTYVSQCCWNFAQLTSADAGLEGNLSNQVHLRTSTAPWREDSKALKANDNDSTVRPRSGEDFRLCPGLLPDPIVG